jgi:autotransporter-associated beta strand protein
VTIHLFSGRRPALGAVVTARRTPVRPMLARRAAAAAAAAAVFVLLPASAFADGIWTGAGADDKWSTPQNWDDGRGPRSGAYVKFPSSAQRPTSFNDLSPLTYFQTLTLAGPVEHTLEGNGLNVGDPLFGGLLYVVGPGTQTLNLPFTPVGGILVSDRAGTLRISGPSGRIVGNRSVYMEGVGTVELSGSTPNTYTGATGVLGNVRLNFSSLPSATNLINPASGLELRGRVEVVGNPSPTLTTSQTFSNTTFSSVSSQIVVNSNGGAGTTLNLGALGRIFQGVLDQWMGTLDISVGPSAVVTTATSNAFFNGGGPTILGGYVTMNGGQTWAVNSSRFGAPGPITPLATFSPTFAAGADVDVPAGAIAAPAGITVNSIRFNAAGAAVTAGGGLQVATGGILVTPSVGTGAVSIDGGSVTSGSDADLVIHQHAAAGRLSIGSTITNHGTMPIALTKAGPGTLALTGNNTFTGPIRLHGGALEVSTLNAGGTPGPLGAAPGSINDLMIGSGTLRYTGGSTSTNRGLTLGGVSGGAIEVAQPTTNLTWAGEIWDADAGGATLDDEGETHEGFAKTGPGTLTLAGTVNNYRTGFDIKQGTLLLNKTNNATPNFVWALAGDMGAFVRSGALLRIDGTNGDQIWNGSGIRVDAGGTFDLNGHSETIGFLRGAGRVTSSAAGGGTHTLSLGAVPPKLFEGVIEDGASGVTAVKSLGGSTTFSGPSTYSGGTEIQSVLSVRGQATATSSAVGTGPVTVAPGGLLAGDGNFPGDLTVRGTYAPGLTAVPAASVALPGNVTFESTGRFRTDIGGTTPGTGHDRVIVGKSAALAGTLELRMTAAFTPAAYDVFDILTAASRTGTFSTVSGVTLPKSAGLSFAVTYSPTDVVVTAALPGDVNLDKVVDGGDFNLLATNFGKTGQTWATADLDGDGLVGAGDFNLLASTFGRSASGGFVAITPADRQALDAFAAANVPEPAGFAMATASLLALTAVRRRREASRGSWTRDLP